MLWAKVALPVVLATAGVGAVVVTAAQPSRSEVTGASVVWIDAPLGRISYAPGTIGVTAHATADRAVTGLELYVDNQKVVADTKLDRTEKLFLGTFAWKAAVGTHQLVVHQVGGDGASSAPRTIVVAEGGVVAPTTPVTTTTLGPGATVPPDTTTTTAVGPTTTLGPEGPVDTVPVTEVPPEGEDTTPVTTAPTTDPPVISSAVVVGDDPHLYVQPCGYRVEVQARVRGADYVQVDLEGTGFGATMAKTASSSWSLTLQSGDWSTSDVGEHRVILTAGGGGASVTKVAGTVDIRATCPKD